MKKVLVAAAGLMLVGTMASTAMAEFYFSGDARARYRYFSDYNDLGVGNIKPTDSEDRFDNRIRVTMKADTKGGAYVVSRVRMDNSVWGTNDPEAIDEVGWDRAYIGVPMGPVVVEAGRQPRDITPFLFNGSIDDGVDVSYKTDTTTLVGFWDTIAEVTTGDDDEDVNLYGGVLVQKFEGGLQLLVGAAYYDDEVSSDSDFGATVQLTGMLGAATLTGEVAYQGEELPGIVKSSAEDDDGWGGYLSAEMPIGSVDLMGMIGFTADGYTWDQGDFGPFEMIGDVNWVNTAINPSEVGETFFAVVNPSFKATEKLTLGGVFAYINTDEYAAGGEEYDMFEISGRATYAVTDGADLIGILGYLETDDYTEDNPVGAAIGLSLSF